MSYQMAKFDRQSRKSSSFDNVLALPKLRVPLKGRILANSDELICNPIVGLRVYERSIHAPLESTKPKITITRGNPTFAKALLADVRQSAPD